MCGIVGVVSFKKNILNILINSLKRLEYRGYDSAGIYIIDKKKKYFIKEKGEIKNLCLKLSKYMFGTIGIGHTRWATHGKASKINAHPHISYSGRLILVHNGIIENFKELKNKFLYNKKFKSETDTEVVVFLIEFFLDKNFILEKAFCKVLSLIKGSYSFALIDNFENDKILIAKNSSPLLIGIGNNINIICSDINPILNITNEIIELSDKEIAIIKYNNIKIKKINGSIVNRKSYKLNNNNLINNFNKKKYKHYMLKEIEEQPLIIKKLIDKYIKNNKILINSKLIKKILKSDKIYIIACGTSYNAGCVGKIIIEKFSNISVEVFLASEFAYYMPILCKKSFFIFLSQSGETADVQNVVDKIKKMKFYSLLITNNIFSILARKVNYVLQMFAGIEISVASTKTYIAQIIVLIFLSKSLYDEKKNNNNKEINLIYEFNKILKSFYYIFKKKNEIKNLVKKNFLNINSAFYIGRGLDYFAAIESALKLKEVSYIHAESFAAGELKHGPISLVTSFTPVISIITDINIKSIIRSNIKEIESRGANSIIISLKSCSEKNDNIIIPNVFWLFSPIVSVLVTQLIAYYSAVFLGKNVDKPRNLAKSVTVE